MEKIKSQKGITIVSLVLTIIIFSILATITTYTIRSSNSDTSYNKMIADISLLEEKLLIYYNKYGETPIIADTEETIDAVSYNKINLQALENVTLNLGMEKETEDYYLVNENLKVYYKKGTEKSGEIVHTAE